MFTSQTGYPKSEQFYSHINTVVALPEQQKNLNLHLEIDGQPWIVELLQPQKFSDRYWTPDPDNKKLYICGITTQDCIDGIKHSCWSMYHTRP